MSAKFKLLAGAAGLAALVGVASPAAAQYPGYGYGYGNNNNVVGQIVGQILGYGRYPYGNYGYNQYNNQSAAIDQCARAVEARLGGWRFGIGFFGASEEACGGLDIAKLKRGFPGTDQRVEVLRAGRQHPDMPGQGRTWRFRRNRNRACICRSRQH